MAEQPREIKMSLPQVVGIVGHLGSGKDAVAEVLVEEFGFTRVGFADALKKEVAQTLPRTLEAIGDYLSQDCDPLGIERLFWGKPAIIRALLQEWGTELRRAEQPDYWVRKWQHQTLGLARVVAPDCRFENEAVAIRNRGGVLWRVVRPGLADSSHLSETAQDHIHVDLTFDNSGKLEELKRQVRWAVCHDPRHA